MRRPFEAAAQRPLRDRAGREGIYFSWSKSPKVVPYAENDERLVIDDICKQEDIICYYSNDDSYMDVSSNMALNMKQIGVEFSMDEAPVIRYALPSYSNTLAICETAQFVNRKGGKVVFTGHGGDEGISHRCNPYELFYHREYILSTIF